MARKHYRAVQKKVEQSPANGIFIPNKEKNKIFIIAICILILAFLKGMFLGYLVSKSE